MSRLIPLMCALAASVAVAQKPRVVLVPFTHAEGTSDTSTQKWNALLVEELRMRAGVLEYVASPPTKAAVAGAPTPGATRTQPSAEAVASLEAGRKAFDDLRFEDAVPSLNKAIEGILADPSTADFAMVTDGYVKLAAAQFRMGEEKAAKESLLALARLTAPNFELPAGFPPVFTREFEKAKKRLDKQPRGSVNIDGPGGSTVFLDGRDLGMVPVTESNVPSGTHFVRVEGGRSERFGQAITVSSGEVKVKAAFSESGPRQVVGNKAVVTDPSVTSKADEGVLARLGPYTKAVGADYALIGYLYKTSDTTLSAGAALYSVQKQAFTQLTPRTFDTDVLTANTESYKLVAELMQRLQTFGSPAPLPVNLAATAAKAGTSGKTVANADTPTNTEDLSVSGPRKKVVVLVPKATPQPDDSHLTENIGERPVEEQKVENKGVPVWVWIVTGVVVAAGAGVGIGFGVAEANKPVTGTINASWK